MMTKHYILALLSRLTALYAEEVSVRERCTPMAASMMLLRMVRQGLLHRTWDPCTRSFVYGLTPKGGTRYHYYLRQTRRESKERNDSDATEI